MSEGELNTIRIEDIKNTREFAEFVLKKGKGIDQTILKSSNNALTHNDMKGQRTLEAQVSVVNKRIKNVQDNILNTDNEEAKVILRREGDFWLGINEELINEFKEQEPGQ